TSPNVMRHNRPEWLAPYNFFLYPIISDLGGFPAGVNKSTCNLIVPFESDRRHWKLLQGINLWDGQIYRLATRHSPSGNTVVPDSLRIMLAQYLRDPEVKSLAPGADPCVSDSRGLLGRMSIQAGRIVLIGKESDRSWEQGEDPSMLDFKLKEYGKRRNLFVAEVGERARWSGIGIRELRRRLKLSQKAIYSVLRGDPVRRTTLATFRTLVDR